MGSLPSLRRLAAATAGVSLWGGFRQLDHGPRLPVTWPRAHEPDLSLSQKAGYAMKMQPDTITYTLTAQVPWDQFLAACRDVIRVRVAMLSQLLPHVFARNE